MKNLIKPALVVGVLLLLAAAPAYAGPLTAANFIVTEDGVGVIAPTAVVSTGGPGAWTAVWTGTTPHFSATIQVASSNQPGTPVMGELQITSLTLSNSDTVAHTLHIQLSDTSFANPPGSPLLLSSAIGGSYAGASPGGSNAEFRSWADATNALFGHGTTTGPQLNSGPGPGPTFNADFTPGTATTLFARGGAYSLTNQIDITLSGGTGADFAGSTATLPSVPAPAGLALVLSGLPLLGLGRLLRRQKA
jgi:hypothetical protein